MAYITNDGSFVSFPIDAFVSYVTLSCTGITDVLVLSEFVENPYSRRLQNLARASGRGLAGAISIGQGNYSPKLLWALAFVVNEAQKSLFESMMAIQSGEQITLVDRWNVALSPLTTEVWVNVDDQYISPYAGVDYLLQIQALEE